MSAASPAPTFRQISATALIPSKEEIELINAFRAASEEMKEAFFTLAQTARRLRAKRTHIPFVIEGGKA